MIKYKKGDILGNNNIAYIKDADPYIWKDKRMRRCLFKCHCGKEFVASPIKVKSNHTTSCGCNLILMIKNVNLQHGKTYSRLWNLWAAIKNRTMNKNQAAYVNYGAKGIKMHKEWINDFTKFETYCKTLDGWDDKSLSIDRINNNGNYEPGNLRFTTRKIQSLNQGMKKNNTSGTKGVSYDKHHEQWQAYIYIDREKYTLYRGRSKSEAIRIRKKFEKKYFKELGV